MADARSYMTEAEFSDYMRRSWQEDVSEAARLKPFKFAPSPWVFEPCPMCRALVDTVHTMPEPYRASFEPCGCVVKILPPLRRGVTDASA